MNSLAFTCRVTNARAFSSTPQALPNLKSCRVQYRSWILKPNFFNKGFLQLRLFHISSHIDISHSIPYSSHSDIMASSVKVPYAPQDVQAVQTLIHDLEEGTKRGKSKKTFSCKGTGFNVSGSSNNLVVQSWRFQDWDYKRPDLPTQARGLFTTKNEKGQPEICIRGYDKFFNQEEVNLTQWRNIENYTKGPYELSLKENGCIIFISGLWDGTLLVCSKHSTGPRNNELSHAVAGEGWINKQLAAIGKTRADLAKELRSRNATAVAELCDDDFEEHILAYDKDKAGLYLHGININIPEFMTYPGDQVQAFAAEWGYQKTDYLVIDE